MIMILGTTMIMSGIMVITTRNTMHAVFSLVMCFVNAAIIMVIWGIDYIGLLLIIVYVGAIAILFLFVVMMINVKKEESNRTKYVPIGLITMIIMMVEIYQKFPEMTHLVLENSNYKINGGSTNINMIGHTIYTWELIMYGSIVLLVAMIGAIVLTINHSQGVKMQDIYRKWEA